VGGGHTPTIGLDKQYRFGEPDVELSPKLTDALHNACCERSAILKHDRAPWAKSATHTFEVQNVSNAVQGYDEHGEHCDGIGVIAVSWHPPVNEHVAV